METRKCMHCSKAIAADKRADTKFCSNSCKANYWEANKGKTVVPVVVTLPQKDKPLVAGQPLEGLRGVLGNMEEIAVRDVKETFNIVENQEVVPVKRETQTYKNAMENIRLTEASIRKAEDKYTEFDEEVTQCYKEKQRLEKEESEEKRRQKGDLFSRYRKPDIDAQAIAYHSGDDIAWRTAHRKYQQELVEKKIERFTNLRNDMEELIAKETRKSQAQQYQLKSIPQYEIISKADSAPLFFQKKEPALLQPVIQAQAENNNEVEKTAENVITIPAKGKLISSRELRGMNYKCLNFQGRWKEFFGLPAVIFHLAVHGKPGEGKSTFCIQLADYLAQNFGEVVYISGEEGFSKTLRDKVVNNKIDNPHLFFADINTLDEITTEIESNKFHFIFIDSLDTLRIDAAKLHELREHYPQSTFVTISQSTKDGKMRGSQEIIHDADITVKVEDGIAETTKNRFHPRGTQFRVFPTEKASVKTLAEPKNII